MVSIMNDRKLPKIVDKNLGTSYGTKYSRAGDGLGISILFQTVRSRDGVFQIKYEDVCTSRDTLEVDYNTGKAKCIVGKLCPE